jgi:hypothetical protein
VYRFQELEKAINKGVEANERRSANSNERVPVIPDWSPNNFRRVIIGFDAAVIVHFVTSRLSPTLIEKVDLRSHAQKDSELLQTDSSKYKPILDALVSGRVLSSIEEIIFCQKGYPSQMANADTTLSRLASGSTNLETRFPRLRHISYVPCGVEDLWNLLPDAKPANKLLLDLLKPAGIPSKSFVELHEEDWWTSTSLRPQYYSMDSTTLAKYFDGLKDTMESTKRTERLEELDAEQDKAFLDKNLPAINSILKWVYDLFAKSQSVFDRASIINKAEWASFLEYKNSCKGIRLELSKNQELVTAARRIDFDRIVRSMRANGIDEEIVRNLLKFRDTVFTHILNNEEEYKRESNKDNMAPSLITIQKLAGTIYNHEVNIVYLAFMRYLTRNSVEFAPFFFEKLQSQVPELVYTRSTVEYWNNHLPTGDAKAAMDKIGARELLVEEFKVPFKYAEANKLLAGLLAVSR